MLTKNSTLSLSEQLRDRFAQRIQSRLLSAGARLPSVRHCAQQQGVSPSTVVAAYDQLLALGLVESRRNSVAGRAVGRRSMGIGWTADSTS